jgi:hypothetical protein
MLYTRTWSLKHCIGQLHLLVGNKLFNKILYFFLVLNHSLLILFFLPVISQFLFSTFTHLFSFFLSSFHDQWKNVLTKMLQELTAECIILNKFSESGLWKLTTAGLLIYPGFEIQDFVDIESSIYK